MHSFNDKDLLDAAELFPSLWIAKHEIKTENGLPIEFKKRKFLIDIYNDLSPLQVWLKPPQIGATVAQTLKSFYVAKKFNRQIIYTLPTQGDVQDMVGGSINRIIAQNPVLMSWVKDHDTVEQKQVGDSMIFYRGTFTAKQAMMIPSGLNIHDEVDASNADVITQYENRLQAQEDGGWRWYFSHPSIAGHGVDIYWEQSDKKEWVITCPTCSHRFVMEWPRNVDREKEAYICHKCQAELPNEARINGEWKKTAIGLYSGYHVSQLMLYNKSAKQVLEAFDDPMKNEQHFYNYVLGLPYVGSENKITSGVVLKNVVPEINEQGDRIIIGVDTGLPIHFTCMNKQGAFYYGQCQTKDEQGKPQDPYEDLRKLLKRWPTSIIIADQGGDLIGIRKLQADYPGRVYLVFYRKDRKSKEMVEWGEKDEQGTVRVDRNMYFQWMVEQLRDTGRIRLNGKPEEWTDWASQFDNVYREIKVALDKPGKDVATNYGAELIWKRNGPDHFCFIAGTLITTDKGNIPIESIKVGDKVLTRKGYKRVYDAGLRRKKEKVVTAYFSNGSKFIATPDHPIIHSQGKERLDSITRHAILYSCQNQKVLYTKGLLTGDIQTLLKEKQEFTFAQMERLEQKELKDSTNKYGLMPMEIFLKGLSYIIKTKIRSITNYLTWCARVESTIKVTTRVIDYQLLLTGNVTSSTLPQYNLFPMNGGVLKQEKSGIAITLIKASFWLFPRYLNALNAVQKALHEAIRGVSSVTPDVVIVGLHENIVKRDVINLSVEDEHEYFANGILVSNCHTLLYALVGLERYGTATATFIKKSDDMRFPMATRMNNTMPARRVLGKKITGYVDF